MSSRLESLPPELFYNICEAIHSDKDYFIPLYNLSMTNKRCRSYASRFMFRCLDLQAHNFAEFTVELARCVETLGHLDVLQSVHSVYITISTGSPSTEPRADYKRIVELLKVFSNMTTLEIYSRGRLVGSFSNGLSEMLAGRCSMITIGSNTCYWCPQ